MKLLKNTFRLCVLLECVFLFSLFYGCSTQLALQSAAVNPKFAAVLNNGQASYFIDEVEIPRLVYQRIGKKRNNVGDFLAWVYTDQTKLENWCENELKLFLKRHNQKVSTDFDTADFILKCKIDKIWCEKKWQWGDTDKFLAEIKLHVIIKNRKSGQKVFNDYLKYYFNIDRSKDRSTQISDEQMFNYCLSTAFQSALEKIKFEQ